MKSKSWLEWNHLIQYENKNPLVTVWVGAVFGLRHHLQRNFGLLDSERYDHLVWRACWLDIGTRIVFILVSQQWLLLVYVAQEFGIRALITSGSKLDQLIIFLATIINTFVVSLYAFPPLVVFLFGESLTGAVACAVVAGLQWLFPTWAYVILNLVLSFILWIASVYFKADWIHGIRLAFPLTLLVLAL